MILLIILVGRSLERWSPDGAIVGVDFAGTVVKFGPGVDENKDGLKIGDRVVSFIHGSTCLL
jgi:NADPH:quinone reductase-like Zn-dependent oxidoreductase